MKPLLTMVVEANGEGDELRRWQLATGVRFPAPPVGLCGRGALSTPGGVHPRGTFNAVAGDASKHCSLGIASATRSSDEQVPDITVPQPNVIDEIALAESSTMAFGNMASIFAPQPEEQRRPPHA